MAHYVVDWTREVWYRSKIEADSLEEAREKFWSGDYDDELDDIFGSEIQDSVEIREVE
jgi:TolB-like protein